MFNLQNYCSLNNVKAPLSVIDPVNDPGEFSGAQKTALEQADIIVIFSVSWPIATEKRDFLTSLMKSPKNRAQAFLIYSDGCEDPSTFDPNSRNPAQCTQFSQNFAPFAGAVIDMANEGVTDPDQLWGKPLGASPYIYRYYYADLNSASPYSAPFAGVKPRDKNQNLPTGDVMGFYNGGAISNVPDEFVLYPLVDPPPAPSQSVNLRGVEEAGEGHQHAIGVFLPKERARGGEGACTLFMADASQFDGSDINEDGSINPFHGTNDRFPGQPQGLVRASLALAASPSLCGCPAGQELQSDSDTCAPIQCPEGQQLQGDVCEAIQCPAGQELQGNECVAPQQPAAPVCAPPDGCSSAPAAQQPALLGLFALLPLLAARRRRRGQA